MARRGLNLFVPVLVAMLFALPLAARDTGKNGNKVTAQLDVLNAITLAGKQLKPGTYEIRADDTKVQMMLDGKVVAEAPVEWKDETNKPKYSQIITTDSQVKEIHFSGKMRYIAIIG